MKKFLFTDERITGVLREAEAGASAGVALRGGWLVVHRTPGPGDGVHGSAGGLLGPMLPPRSRSISINRGRTLTSTTACPSGLKWLSTVP